MTSEKVTQVDAARSKVHGGDRQFVRPRGARARSVGRPIPPIRRCDEGHLLRNSVRGASPIRHPSCFEVDITDVELTNEVFQTFKEDVQRTVSFQVSFHLDHDHDMQVQIRIGRLFFFFGDLCRSHLREGWHRVFGQVTVSVLSSEIELIC